MAGAAAFGAGIVLFSLSQWYLVSLGLLLLMGGVQSLYMTSINTALQALVPDGLRGRVMGLYTLTYSLIPVGGMIGGVLAPVAGAPIAVALGGTPVTIMSITVARRAPEVRHLS